MVANGVVSWLRAALLAFPIPQNQWHVSRRVDARYSGGAAPDSHRLPCPVLFLQLSVRTVRNTAILACRARLGKRAGKCLA